MRIDGDDSREDGPDDNFFASWSRFYKSASPQKLGKFFYIIELCAKAT
jgi:hypothetical protein